MAPEPLATPTNHAPIAGKGKRGVGTFFFLLGAGLVLESSVPWIGGLLMLFALIMLALGLAEGRPRPAAHAPPQVAIDPQTESRL